MVRTPEQVALKGTAKRMLTAVRLVLWEIWDPISVNDHADASTEYDSYAPRIVRMLLEDCTAHDLEHHLSELETDSMGLAHRSSSAARDATVAALLSLPR
jgi:hypothetical protein